MRAWFPSSDLFSVRVAGVLHLPNGTTSDVITAQTMDSALELCDYLVEHALELFSPSGDPGSLALAGRILDLARATDSFSQRDLYRRMNRKKDDVLDALELLEANHCIRARPCTVGPTGGRPSQIWEFNPDLPTRRPL